MNGENYSVNTTTIIERAKGLDRALEEARRELNRKDDRIQALERKLAQVMLTSTELLERKLAQVMLTNTELLEQNNRLARKLQEIKTALHEYPVCRGSIDLGVACQNGECDVRHQP